MQPPYPISSIPQMYVDHVGMQHLFDYCSQEGARVALIGFNECAKHLVNMCEDKIVGIYEQAEQKLGINFRGKQVVGPQEMLEINRIAVCDRLLGLDFADKISLLYDEKIPVYMPPSLDGTSTAVIQPFEQEKFYKDLYGASSEAPLSMVNREKTSFLVEMLLYGLRKPGAVIEMGVWQGGSAWYLAKTMSLLGEDRELIIFDQFENLMNNRNATVCNDEVRRKLGFHSKLNMIVGLVADQNKLNEIDDRQYCFAHYDLGFYKAPLDYLWERLSAGAPLILDNYSFTAAEPARCDRFFGTRGARVIRIPWSGQGLVIKD